MLDFTKVTETSSNYSDLELMDTSTILTSMNNEDKKLQMQ